MTLARLIEAVEANKHRHGIYCAEFDRWLLTILRAMEGRDGSDS